MSKLSDVESIIEYMAGYKSADGDTFSLFASEFGKCPLSLTRYDHEFVTSVAMKTNSMSYALSDRQSELAIKIIKNYRRQFQNNNIDISAADNATFRNKPRIIDRTRKIYIDGKNIIMQFPWDKRLNAMLNEYRMSEQGIGVKRVIESPPASGTKNAWSLQLTEPNINWAVTIGSKNDFAIDQSILDIMQDILAIESNAENYAIELAIEDGQVVLRNAESSLLEFLTEQIGELTLDNLHAAVDYSSELQFDIQNDLRAALSAQYNDTHMDLVTTALTRYDRSEITDTKMSEIVEYAKVTNRFPIYVYQDREAFATIRQFFRPEEVLLLMKNEKEPVSPEIRLVYTEKLSNILGNEIPLAISGEGMVMHVGFARTQFLQDAKKIVIFATAAYVNPIGKLQDCKRKQL